MTDREKLCAASKRMQKMEDDFEDATKDLGDAVDGLKLPTNGVVPWGKIWAVVSLIPKVFTEGRPAYFAFRKDFRKLKGEMGVACGELVEPDEEVTIPPIEIDLKKVRWLHTNVRKWPVTMKVTDVDIEEQEICINHTGHSWPAPNGTWGNPWVFAKIDGRWVAGTFEWMRPGQVCKVLDPDAGGATIADRIGLHVKQEPLESWKPVKGEMVGFMYSGWARDSRRSVEERSNVVLVEWPY